MAIPSITDPALQVVLEELELLRKKIVNKKTQGWGAIILGFITFLVLSAYGYLEIGIAILACGLIPGAFILYKIGDEVAAYKDRFKTEIIGTAFLSINQTLVFEPHNGISEVEFQSSQLFTKDPDRYFTEDLVTGKTGKTSFYFSEAHAEYKTETQTKNGSRTEWHDIFKGIIFVADFNKNFNGVTVVRPKDFGNQIGAWFSKNVFSIGSKDLIELENVGFNKDFVTYGTDQVEARYILTPAMMDRICELNHRSAYCVSLSFINSSMYIAFPLDKNYFEPPIFKTLLKPDLLEDDLSVLNFMHGIVNELDLNTRIWTKQ